MTKSQIIFYFTLILIKYMQRQIIIFILKKLDTIFIRQKTQKLLKKNYRNYNLNIFIKK